MKKRLMLLFTLSLALGLVTGCGNTIIVQQPETMEAKKEPGKEGSTPEEKNEVLKTGLSVETTLSGENATQENLGYSTANVTVVAVLVDNQGVIRDCSIDEVKATVEVSQEGKLMNLQEDYPSKKELGDSYGMKSASSIGKEWDEQIRALEEYAIGKTVDELKQGAVDEGGMAKDVDLATSATLYIGGFIQQIEKAVNQALGAET